MPNWYLNSMAGLSRFLRYAARRPVPETAAPETARYLLLYSVVFLQQLTVSVNRITLIVVSREVGYPADRNTPIRKQSELSQSDIFICVIKLFINIFFVIDLNHTSRRFDAVVVTERIRRTQRFCNTSLKCILRLMCALLLFPRDCGCGLLYRCPDCLILHHSPSQ